MVMGKCSSGKRMFTTQAMAEDALIDLWSKNVYIPGRAPIAIYKCDDCGEFHLTSQGTMNEQLSEAIKTGKIKLHQEAKRWEDKWKRK
jgi:hypothetical protein